MLRYFFFFFFIPLVLFGFEVSPWFGTIAQLEMRPSYSYSFYSQVNSGGKKLSYSSHDQWLDLNLGVSFLPTLDIQTEANFSNTRRLSWGTNRVGLQLRYLFLNDISKDPISLASNIQIFYVPTRSLRDVSSPYHAQGNLEWGWALGKEIAKDYHWNYRLYSYLGVGSANRGSLWSKQKLSFKFNYRFRHHLEAFVKGYFGFGNRKKIFIDHFNGFAKIAHRSVDLGASYHFLFEVWGTLSLRYTYRIYARFFPEYENRFTFEYRFPFSLL